MKAIADAEKVRGVLHLPALRQAALQEEEEMSPFKKSARGKTTKKKGISKKLYDARKSKQQYVYVENAMPYPITIEFPFGRCEAQRYSKWLYEEPT